MGFLAKIKGFRGIPDWVSGTVKNLVINSDGEVFQKDESGGGNSIISSVGMTLADASNTSTKTPILTLDDIALNNGDMILLGCIFRLTTPPVSGGIGKMIIDINGNNLFETDLGGTSPHPDNPGYTAEFYFELEIHRNGDYLKVVHNRLGTSNPYGDDINYFSNIHANLFNSWIYNEPEIFNGTAGFNYDYETNIGWVNPLEFVINWEWDNAYVDSHAKMVMGRAEKKELNIEWNF